MDGFRKLHGAEVGDGVCIAAKRLRYTCDAVAGTFGDDVVELSNQAQRIQEILGEQQDAVVAAAYLAATAARSRLGSIGFGLGIMFARQEAPPKRLGASLPRRGRRYLARSTDDG